MTDPNRKLLEATVQLLAPEIDEFVFVGGCITGLLITDSAAVNIRATKDVDTIVNVTSYVRYTELSERLRKIGLIEDTSDGAPLCRWRYDSLIVDVMPIDQKILGFNNQWYPIAMNTANYQNIAGQNIRIITPPLFIATKLEAFHNRGRNDLFLSHDLEDIIAVIDGRPTIVQEIDDSHEQVSSYIASEFKEFLGNPDFLEALSGYLLPDAASQARLKPLRERLATISSCSREYRISGKGMNQ